ncbi:CRISPR-associated endonuclease cas1 [Enterococcus sp. AZ078]|uniref:type II CRISPR-associated endonuclease Cas1 n=1 Tax=Enterococcus sp. AZ078 TaxID=2774710 RepID=UPI002ECCCE7D|nr:type II CRISPR-associated endonuclease Cas1 [Enterococcus hirae]
MGWRTVVINTHSKLTYANNHLVFKNAQKTEKIHLSEIDILILETTDITITTMLLKRLTDEKILVIFCDDKRLPSSQLFSYYGRHDSSLQLSKQIQWESDLKGIVWTTIIAQKIHNQCRFLQENDFVEKASALSKLSEELETFDPTNREGHAARIYFQTLFGNQFTREESNEINAGLDYGYTLLMSLFAREIVKNGCMTQFGLKHANQFNDFNLASDLMEPFRPLVDQIVYTYRDQPFPIIKRRLFDLFSQKYLYGKKEMFLTNIVTDYTNKTIKTLNNEGKGVPYFGI